MHTQRFDDLTRSLASGSSRRTLVRGMLGGAVAVVGLRAGSTVAAPADKITICHLEDDGSYHAITISKHAFADHEAHGDLGGPFACGSDPGYALDTESCTCVPVCNHVMDSCGHFDNGRCEVNADTGKLVCVQPLTGCFPCATAADCDAGEGDICARNVCGLGVSHCVHLFPSL
jgi:hypothetical protein